MMTMTLIHVGVKNTCHLCDYVKMMLFSIVLVVGTHDGNDNDETILLAIKSVCSVATCFVDIDMLVSDRHCWCSYRN